MSERLSKRASRRLRDASAPERTHSSPRIARAMNAGRVVPYGRIAAESAPEPVAPEALPRHRAIDYDLNPTRTHWAVVALQKATPGLHYLTHNYNRAWWRPDVIAGLAVAAYLIPQVMAYAAIVGVPPVIGLYTALVSLVVYAAMGSSRVLSVGPESTIALLAGTAVAQVSTDPSRVLALTAALTLLVAGWCFVARALRLGVMADLLSQPLLIGYLAGAAVLMVVGQLGKLSGTHVSGNESIVEQVRSFLDQAGGAHLLTVYVGLATLAFIFLIHWVRPSWPAALIAVIAATIASVTMHLGDQGVAIVGYIPRGLPVPHLPAVSLGELQALMVPALGVAVLAYSDNMLAARAFPSPEVPGERPSERAVDTQVELVALGGVHLASGLVGGFPVSSSGSRTALALASRARTQAYSLVAAGCVLLMLFIAGPLMQQLPQAALGAVVVYAATKLVKVGEARRMWRFRKREVFLAGVTLVGTIWLGLLAGVGVAIAISLLEMAQRLARPHDAVLGRVPGLAGMHDTADYPDAETLPGLIIYRYEAPLFFANAGDLQRRAQRVVDKEFAGYPDAPPRWFLLNVEANTEVDVTACDGLKELYADLRAQNVRLGLVRLKQDLYQPLRRAGVVDLIGEDMLFPTLPVAEEAYVEWAAANPPAPPAGTEATSETTGRDDPAVTDESAAPEKDQDALPGTGDRTPRPARRGATPHTDRRTEPSTERGAPRAADGPDPGPEATMAIARGRERHTV